MANTQLFNTKKAVKQRGVPVADAKNAAGGKAYSRSAEEALAQYAATGTFGNTFYVKAEDQLKEVGKLALEVSPEFLAKVAVYSRHKAHMKDMPAFLLAVLSSRDVNLFKQVFDRVIDNGRMLRNFVQIMRSGATGRTSLGTAPKKKVEEWLAKRTPEQLLRDMVGNTPSLADVIKMVHPTPENKARSAAYAYLCDRKYDKRSLPKCFKEYEAFKAGEKGKRVIPDVPFQLLTSADLSDTEWKEIAKNAKWQMTRMNLNTFARHNVLKDAEMVDMIAARLRDEKLVRESKNFPYQLFASYMFVEDGVPTKITNALQDAMEVAVSNVPKFEGKVSVLVDTSGSMSSNVTGDRGTATSKMRYVDVAALIASVVLRQNDEAKVYGFDTQARHLCLNGRDSVMTNAKKINTPGGGTDVGCGLRMLNAQKSMSDLVIIVSDNESWFDGSPPVGYWGFRSRGTNTAHEWAQFKARNPNAKIVCINVAPMSTVQVPDDKSVLNVGGFSDQVFEVIAAFMKSGGKSDYWAKYIDATVKLHVN